MVYSMASPSMDEKHFWKFFDSLPESDGRLAQFSSSHPVDRILGLCSRIYTKGSRDSVAFFYIKASTHTPIHMLLESSQSNCITDEIGAIIRQLADNHDGISTLFEHDGFLLVIPIKKSVDSCLKAMANRFQDLISAGISATDIAIDLNIGASIFPRHSRNVQELIRYSMLSAFSSAVNQHSVTIYDKDFDNRAKRQNTILAGISRLFSDASVSDELAMHYQPKYSLESGKIVGFEALSRWNHSSLGYVPPAEFIPLVERTKLIQPLTQFIIKKTVADIATNRDEGFELPVAVNISVKDLIDPNLIPFIQKTVLTHQVPHHLLEIEITETSILENTELAIQRIHQLQHAGFNVAIDDFGTGHSSLAYLAHLPVSYIKIDPLFIREIHNERTGIIVKSIIELAAKIGVGLVAEGVEDIQALRVLKSLHCPIVQGFFLGRPMPRTMAVTNRINMGS